MVFNACNFSVEKFCFAQFGCPKSETLYPPVFKFLSLNNLSIAALTNTRSDEVTTTTYCLPSVSYPHLVFFYRHGHGLGTDDF